MKGLRPAVLVFLASCATPQQAPPAPPTQTIKIASFLPKSGSAAWQSADINRGIQCALWECGERVGDFRLELVEFDYTSIAGGWSRSEKVFDDALDSVVQDPDVMAVI